MKTSRSFGVLALSLGLLSLPSAGQVAGPSADVTGTLVWSHGDPARGAPWVSLGDEGGQVLAHFPAACCQTQTLARLFSAFATDADPVWESRTRVDVPGAVASAAQAPIHVSALRQAPELASPGRVHVRRWSSSSHEPDWVYVHAAFTFEDPWVGVSRDGARVVLVSARIGALGGYHVVALDGATGALMTQTTVVPIAPDAERLAAALSADGGLLALRLGARAHLVDVVSGAVLDHVDDPPVSFTGRAVGLSADGAVLALADAFPGTVRLLERTGDSWQLVHTWEGATQASSCAVAVSDDGTTAAATFGSFPFPGTAIWSLALDVPSRSETMSHLELLCCGIGYSPSDLAITPDGARFVVGVSGGDELGGEPRVRVHARDEDAPLVTFVTAAATISSVAISPDGEHVAVGSGQADSDGEVQLFALSGSDFRVAGAPILGESFDFVLGGVPGQAGFVLVAGAPAVPPLDLPGLGTLYLDPAELLFLPMGTIGPAGSATLNIDVPASAFLLGVSLWTQGLQLPDEVLSNDWRKLTLLP